MTRRVKFDEGCRDTFVLTYTMMKDIRTAIMRISRIAIKNFRNFADLDIKLGAHAVVVGANGVGKSNLLYALRLVLDPSLPDSLRQLRVEDLWDGLGRTLSKDIRVEVLVELTDFEDNDDLLATLGSYLVSVDPMVARLTYAFRASSDAPDNPSLSQFEFVIFGGDREENSFKFDHRRRIPMDLIHALRDAEADLASWRHSPLRPLLERAWSDISADDKKAVAAQIDSSTASLSAIGSMASLQNDINSLLDKLVDDGQPLGVQLRFADTDPEKLVRAIRLYFGERKGISETSLGSANIVYIVLRMLELRHLVSEHERDHTFVAIEEPEAHLHPQLQRQIFRGFLRLRPHLHKGDEPPIEASPTTILLTTHSSHVASIAPLSTLVLLRKVNVQTTQGGKKVTATIGTSTAALSLEQHVIDDLERYLEATRAEILFARGVILVEGEAELYLIPKIAELLGTPLDRHGITVSSVGGTHFSSHVKLLSALGIPFAVVTDGDPDESGIRQGLKRAASILSVILAREVNEADPAFAALSTGNGLFVGTSTFEIDLLNSGRSQSIPTTLSDLAPTNAAKLRATAWLNKSAQLDKVQILKDIKAIGKGRFAQRLASSIKKMTPRRGTLTVPLQGPKYVVDAINHIMQQLANK